MLTDTVLQATLKKKKSVSKLEVKDTKKASEYMVTTQDVGSDGEFQTRYYKVSFDLFSNCFVFPCVFEDYSQCGHSIWPKHLDSLFYFYLEI